MPRYFLHYISAAGDRVTDLVEPDFENWRDARREAVIIARELMGDRLISGRPVDFGYIEILNDDGDVVGTVSLHDALHRDPEIDPH